METLVLLLAVLSFNVKSILGQEGFSNRLNEISSNRQSIEPGGKFPSLAANKLFDMQKLAAAMYKNKSPTFLDKDVESSFVNEQQKMDLPRGFIMAKGPSRQYKIQNNQRLEELSPEEREEKINRSFARMMQMMTFLGHVDNYLTDKASSVVKLMSKAMDAEDPNDAYRMSRTCQQQ